MADKYDELFNAKKLALENARLNNMNSLGSLEKQTNDNYNEARQGFNDQRNAVDVGVAQNLARLREQAAAKGWLNGGEGLQMQLNANTDRMNGLGRVATQEDSVNRDRLQKLYDINQKRSLYDQTYNNDLQALQSEIASQRMAEAQAQAKAQAVARQRAAEQAQQYKNTVFKNDNQMNMYSDAMGRSNKDDWATRMRVMYQAAANPALSDEDRSFADSMGQAIRVGNYYDGAYDQYTKYKNNDETALKNWGKYRNTFGL